ncbi:hypothetical protein [Vitiosangium sp. GDMCC 1.1324]|uniref:hypothetical protein n=1 Tax=Vitiosangium sp. (strain GDMCC 1.1324) TaxID=2138576 RepID=UPI000D386814|nr:hypothetical protein [Vitiosangium sp. GDMCC 1.1324]PTL82965.1 hypothetical protein DAT35_13145 [Vitiosangium sp. GDMCC 1.1324]
MTEDFSASRLIELVHRYYPINLYGGEEGYDDSEQYQRMLALREHALKNPMRWKMLLARLREALPECKVEDWTALFSDDNCWRVRVYLPEARKLPGGVEEARAVVVLVSILAPVYVLYSSFQQYAGKTASPSTRFYEDIPETKPYADKVEAIVRDVLNVHRLPNETLFTPVPDIQVRNTSLGDAKLIDCLFTDDRW